MVKNVSKTNNYLSPQNIEHKNIPHHGAGNPGPALDKYINEMRLNQLVWSHIVGRVDLIKKLMILCFKRIIVLILGLNGNLMMTIPPTL